MEFSIVFAVFPLKVFYSQRNILAAADAPTIKIQNSTRVGSHSVFQASLNHNPWISLTT
jgi:hypothetical protein